MKIGFLYCETVRDKNDNNLSSTSFHVCYILRFLVSNRRDKEHQTAQWAIYC